MLNPYFFMALLYLFWALLGAVDVALVNFDLLPAFAGMRWIRIHFITLGAITQVIFGLLPYLVAKKQKTNWNTWLMLNLGLLTLLVSIPMISRPLITLGGALVFIAVVMLFWQVFRFQVFASATRKFYLAGIVYLLLGILVGTGLWQSWLGGLNIKTPLEVHIHANSWGFMSLVFAGVMIDLLPILTKMHLSEHTINSIFWLMTLGAAGLVFGPWFGSTTILVPGLIMHLTATIWLLVAVGRTFKATGHLAEPGSLHMLTSYTWILLPVMIAPLILLEIPGIPGALVEQNAPQALIYGWVLMFGYALLPFIFRRGLLDEAHVHLGGNWISLTTTHLAGILFWIGIFIPSQIGVLQGSAYLLWAVSLAPIVWELWRIAKTTLEKPPSDFVPVKN